MRNRAFCVILVSALLVISEAVSLRACSGYTDLTPLRIISFTASPNPACVGQAVTFTVTAEDMDRDNGTPVNDTLTYDWSPGGSGGPTKTITYSTPGTYQVFVVVDDLPRYWPDNYAIASVTVDVCGLTLSANTTDMAFGCGYEDSAFITCNAQGACAGQEPNWAATGPLHVGDHGPAGGGAYYALVWAEEPVGCSQEGMVTAQIQNCKSEMSIAVRQVGSFEFSSAGSPITEQWDGTQTFTGAGITPPPGCSPLSPVYGITVLYRYNFDIGCPLPFPMEIGEFVEIADGCAESCGRALRPPPPETLPQGHNGGGQIEDRYGVVSCSCDPTTWGSFLPLNCKIKQIYYIGQCQIQKQCVSINESSSTGDCVGLTISVSLSDYDSCSCQGP